MASSACENSSLVDSVESVGSSFCSVAGMISVSSLLSVHPVVNMLRATTSVSMNSLYVFIVISSF